MHKPKGALIWLDLEMTGLSPETDFIIEIATIITDKDLNIVAEGPVFAIHQPHSVLDSMDEWNKSHHGASGLIERVKASKVTAQEAEKATIDFISQYVALHKSPMCGNSVHQDRFFLKKYMPKLEQYFHYRNLDVSTIKILADLWAPTVADGMQKTGNHVALEDVKDSIAELRYYREHFIKYK